MHFLTVREDVNHLPRKEYKTNHTKHHKQCGNQKRKIHGAFAAIVVSSGKVEADDRNDAGLQAEQWNEKETLQLIIQA